MDQLAATVRDLYDKCDIPLTDPRIQRAVIVTCQWLLQLDPDPSERTLIAHAAVQRALDAIQ